MWSIDLHNRACRRGSRARGKPADLTPSRRIGCTARGAQKKPRHESGAKSHASFTPKGLAASVGIDTEARAQHRRQATYETPSQTVGFGVGRPTKPHEKPRQ